MHPFLPSSQEPLRTSARTTAMPQGITAASKSSSNFSAQCQLQHCWLGLPADTNVCRGELNLRADVACLTSVSGAQGKTQPPVDIYKSITEEKI